MPEKTTTTTMCWADSTGEPSKETRTITLNKTCTMSEKLPQLRCVELTVLVSLQRKHRKATAATMCWADSTGEPSKETRDNYFK